MKPPNRILKISVLCSGFIVVFFFLGFSTILNFIVRDQTALRNRNLMRKFYLKLPVALNFAVYFFNISNPSEVLQGQKPKVQEIGPYSYDAYKEKIDIMENEGEDSLTYTPYETYFFNQQRSAPLSDNDYVTILHPLIVGMVNTVSRDSPPLLPIVNSALKAIFGNPQSIYVTVKVKDILFEGMVINCSAPTFSAKAVCTQLKSQIPGLTEVQKNIYKFSLLGPRNGTLPKRFKVFRGIKKSRDLGRLVELDHEKELTIWSTKRCNTFKGTDGWIFPPFILKDEGIWTFSADLCRNVHAVYVEGANYRNIFVEKYYADLGDMSKNPGEKCYCPKTCLPKGVVDLTKCMGVPIYATLPHFLRADEIFLKQIDGLNPVTEEHIVRILMQPLLGVPLSAQKRMQFNLPIQKSDKIGLMKTLPEALHPIFWIEESIDLDGSLFKMIKSIFILLKVVDIIKYVLLVIALCGVGFGGFLQYKDIKSVKVTPLNQNDDDVKEIKIDEDQTKITD